MYLITGASGFVGRELLKKNDNFKALYRCNKPDNFEPSICISSIGHDTDFSGSFKDVKVIIHLAGLAHSNKYSEHNYQLVNTEGTLHLASEAVKAGVKRFVFVSSVGVNGLSTKELPFTNSSDINPHNAYAKSKYLAEAGLKKIAEKTGLEVVIVRPTLVYGANAPGNFGQLAKLVQKLPLLPFGCANNKRDFIAVQNLVDLLLTCAKHQNAPGHIFLASDRETVSIKEFTNAIASGIGKSIIQLPVPLSLIRLAAGLLGKTAIAEQLLGNLQVDSSNSQEVLGWVPPYTMKQAMASLFEIKND